jgi:hypothetical protein
MNMKARVLLRSFFFKAVFTSGAFSSAKRCKKITVARFGFIW